MLNIGLIFFVCIALAMSLFIGVYALFRSQSSKRNYFLLMQLMIVVYLLGYLLEITSTTAEEAYSAVKVLYLGANFVAVFALFFAADYCNVTFHPLFVKSPLLFLASAATLSMWTNKLHFFIYSDYHFQTAPVNNLVIVPGPFYPLNHSFPAVCMILVMVLLLYQMKQWEKQYRKQIFVFLACAAIPFVTEGVYFVSVVTGINEHQLYFTPHSLAIMSLCLYLGVIRFNVFEIISIATVSAMEHIREGFILVDDGGNYMSSNPAAAKILPGIEKLVKGESIYNARDWPKELIALESGTADFMVSGECARFYTASINPVIAKNEKLMAKIILFREITDSVNLMKELENAAYIDALTGLYNRKHFAELANVDIERSIRLDQSIFTVMLDLDFFKQVNDTFGHAAGDMVLKTTAAIVRQTIRSYDLLCRYGGEEFVLVISDLDVDEAYKLMERIRDNMENNVTHFEGHEIIVTCSIGLAKFTDGDTLETAIRKADEALYAAKHSGRNVVKVYGSLEGAPLPGFRA